MGGRTDTEKKIPKGLLKDTSDTVTTVYFDVLAHFLLTLSYCLSLSLYPAPAQLISPGRLIDATQIITVLYGTYGFSCSGNICLPSFISSLGERMKMWMVPTSCQTLKQSC
jgi:hypothetical protein